MMSVLIRDKKGKVTERQKRRRQCSHEGEDWWDPAVSQGMSGATEAGKAKNGISLRAFKGSTAFEFRLLTSDCKRIDFYCFTPPSLW